MTAFVAGLLCGALFGVAVGALIGFWVHSGAPPPDPGSRSPAPRRRTRLRLVGKRAA